MFSGSSLLCVDVRMQYKKRHWDIAKWTFLKILGVLILITVIMIVVAKLLR